VRREALFGTSRELALSLFEAAPYVDLATTLPDGTPVLRSLDAALVDGELVFHGSPVGEKVGAVGRAAVATAVDRVAFLPSHFVDPERACPATTLYRSAQIHGVLEEITRSDEKARALEALLGRHQPEGGYVPLDADGPLYRKALASLLVVRLRATRLDGKAKLCQNRSPADRRRVLEGLWRRGAAGDLRAIELVRAACPDTPLPAFLEAPSDATLLVDPGPREAAACAELLADAYWNDRFSKEELRAAHLGSSAWVCAVRRGEVLATARAVSDDAKRAWIYDVVTAPAERGQGLARAVMRTLLDHPRVRRARLVELGTRDAMHLYEGLGFVRASDLPKRHYESVHMVLSRPGPA
jgi:ribosomal protein S18 acetylase RimI-like enzyme/nitroimidazol reductase NimA-like FMN-containing flavoprotein (pyridoxamine 5'-phosphate oxidase superfamily)